LQNFDNLHTNGEMQDRRFHAAATTGCCHSHLCRELCVNCRHNWAEGPCKELPCRNGHRRFRPVARSFSSRQMEARLAAAEAEQQQQQQQLAAAGGLAIAAGGACVSSRLSNPNPDPGMMMHTVAALQLWQGNGCKPVMNLASDQQLQQYAGDHSVANEKICSDQASYSAITGATAAAAAARGVRRSLPGSPAAPDVSCAGSSSAAFNAAWTQLQGDTIVPWFNPASAQLAGPAAAAAAAMPPLFDAAVHGATDSFGVAFDTCASVFTGATAASSFETNWAAASSLQSFTVDAEGLGMSTANCSLTSPAHLLDWHQQGQMQAPATLASSGGPQLQQQQQYLQMAILAGSCVCIQKGGAPDSLQLLPAVSSALCDALRPEAGTCVDYMLLTAGPNVGCSSNSSSAGLVDGQICQPHLQGDEDPAIAAIDSEINQQISKLLALRSGIAVRTAGSSSAAAAAAADAALGVTSNTSAAAAVPAAALATVQPYSHQRAAAAAAAAAGPALNAGTANVARMMLAAQAALRAAGCEESSCFARPVPANLQQASHQANAPMQAGNSCGVSPSYGPISGANVMVVGQGITGMDQVQVGNGGLGGVMHAGDGSRSSSSGSRCLVLQGRTACCS
jgi:hypothetical protein